MICRICKGDTLVRNTHHRGDGTTTRTRVCRGCGRRFKTCERVEQPGTGGRSATLLRPKPPGGTPRVSMKPT